MIIAGKVVYGARRKSCSGVLVLHETVEIEDVFEVLKD